MLYNEHVDVAPPGGTGGAATVAPAAAPATAPVQTPAAPASWINPDGSFVEGWHKNLGDAYAPYAETAVNFKSVGDLVKSVVRLRGSGPKYPGDQATPEDISRFREAAQVPADAKGYGLTPPENLPEGVTWDQATADHLAEIAHKHHIPAPALKALAAAQAEVEAGRAKVAAENQAKALQEAQNTLVNEWRGDYDANLSMVRHTTGRLAEAAGIDPADASLAAMSNNPAFAKLIMQVVKNTGEGGVRTPAGTGDLRSARQRADEIMKGTDTQWGKAYQEGDTKAMEVVSNLLREAQK